MIDAGWMTRRDDPIRSNRSTYELREPLVRFHRLVIEPNEHRLELGVDARKVWHDAEHTVASLILGPQLEQLAYDWALLFADHVTFNGAVAAVGPTNVGNLQIDFAAVEHLPRGGRRLLALGEAKALTTRVGVDLVNRLDHACELLVATPPKGVQVPPTVQRVVFSRSGFTNELRRLADRRNDIELVDLERLYSGN